MTEVFTETFPPTMLVNVLHNIVAPIVCKCLAMSGKKMQTPSMKIFVSEPAHLHCTPTQLVYKVKGKAAKLFQHNGQRELTCNDIQRKLTLLLLAEHVLLFSY